MSHAAHTSPQSRNGADMKCLPFELRRILGATQLQPWLVQELEVLEVSEWNRLAALGRIGRLGLATEAGAHRGADAAA